MPLRLLHVFSLKINYFLCVRHLLLVPVEKANNRSAAHRELPKKNQQTLRLEPTENHNFNCETFSDSVRKKCQQKFSCCKCHVRLKYRLDFMCFMVWLQFSPRTTHFINYWLQPSSFYLAFRIITCIQLHFQ